MNRRQLLQAAAALPAAGLAAAATQQKQLKITALQTDVITRPPGTPIYDAIHKLGVDQGNVVLRLSTDAGTSGPGWAIDNVRLAAGGDACLAQQVDDRIFANGFDP